MQSSDTNPRLADEQNLVKKKQHSTHTIKQNFSSNSFLLLRQRHKHARFIATAESNKTQLRLVNQLGFHSVFTQT